MAVVTAAQLNKARKELEQQPGMTATKGCQLLSARFGVTERYIRRLFTNYGLAWNIPEVKTEDNCRECGEPVFCRALCTRHYFQRRRETTPKEITAPCEANRILGNADTHEWMLWGGRTVCTRCRETKQSAKRTFKEWQDVPEQDK